MDEGLPIPSKDECTSAMLAHILQVFGNFFAPLVIFIVKRDSYYVRFHALQALLWQVCALIFTMVTFFGFFVVMIATTANTPTNSKEVPAVLFFFPFIRSNSSFSLLILKSWIN